MRSTSSRTSREPGRRRVPDLGTRRLRAHPLLTLSLCALAVAASVLVPRRPSATTHIEVTQHFDAEIREAKVGTVYNFAVRLWVRGPAAVRIVSARALDSDRGLDQFPVMVGNSCEGGEFALDIVGDPSNRPVDLRPLATSRLRQSGRDPCWYALLRFVPRRLGRLAARRGEMIYAVAGTQHTVHFDFEGAVVVNGTGHDDRDTPAGG